MFVFLYDFDGIGGNGAKAYQCVSCNSLITYSDRLVPIGGRNRHLFINPAGVECDFHTFHSCPGAIAIGASTEAHTWFPGYTWQMAFCRRCGRHLGWYYQKMGRSKGPGGFWGILVSHVVSQ